MTILLKNLGSWIMMHFTHRVRESVVDEAIYNNNALIIQGKFIENIALVYLQDMINRRSKR